MSKTLAAIVVASALTVGSSAINKADAMPLGDMSGVRTAIDNLNIIDKAQYVWGGRRYCWYNNAWSGPGWYWCGYAFRQGYGWGGVEGWHGWRRGEYRRHERREYRHERRHERREHRRY